MARVEKTVFISYRRTNAPWALAIFQNLHNNGYDVFFDYEGIASGDFEGVILGNIRARAHFIVLLTPSALERCSEPTDWLRREIEEALAIKRNIVPLMLEGFDFGTPAIANQLTGKLAALRKYNALDVPASYFMAAMDRLREKFLNVPLEGVLHPASPAAQEATESQQAAAGTAPAVQEKELTAQQWFERGFDAKDLDEKIRFYSQAIRLESDFAVAFNNRGLALHEKGDLEDALKDYTEAIRLEPELAGTFYNRGRSHLAKGDSENAVKDCTKAIRLKPDYALAFIVRGLARKAMGDIEGALKDYDEAIRLKPDYAVTFNNRGITRKAKGDLTGALQDYNEAIRLKPDYANVYYNRTAIYRGMSNYGDAIADFQKYLDLGGGTQNGNQQEVKREIRDLRNKLAASQEKPKTSKMVKSRKKK
jgi:tetratricopeptide (TPR) repeat protein